MSTRGNICVKVKEKDYDKVNTIITPYVKEGVSDSKPYIFIYNHHDSYPEGLGTELCGKYNSYEKALMLVLEGDCSWPGTSYTSIGEEFNHNCPRVVSNFYDANQNEYLYVFENECWRGFDYNNSKLNL